jgi:ribose 5-phosphate isomerase B
MKTMKLAIGADHAGYSLKEKLKAHLISKGHDVKDYGCYSEERADYPDFAHPVALAVEKGDAELGVLMCGSGNGINMAANKHKGIRSALCWTPEIAELAKQHNDANIITLPARYISEEEAIKALDVFLATSFEGGRHADRVKKISNC